MKKIVVLTAAFLIAVTGAFAQNKAGRKDSAHHILLLYTCPMHPDVTSDKPGKCPKCGMALEEKKMPHGRKNKKDTTGMKM